MARRIKTPVIHFNGVWLEANATLLAALTPGVVRGRGVFETIAVVEGQMCFWPEHEERFRRGLHAYGLTCRHGRGALRNLLQETIQRNGLRDGRLRLARYVDQLEKVLVIVGLPGKPRTEKGRGLAVQVSAHRRNKTRTAHLKSIEYQPFYAAHRDALAQGYHEALLLSPDRAIVEGSTTNVFVVKDRVLYTPAVSAGCLNGIVRQQVIKLAKEQGISVRRGAYPLQRLFQADEVFLTNSLIGLQPVVSIDQKSVSRQRLVTQDLKNAFITLSRKR
ncbi:MAG: aminotransferase class IV [Candidatus Omnitrophica bacterium]|nr:aminotransferase class IV [Candidatus Omnitrophota bacterium]